VLLAEVTLALRSIAIAVALAALATAAVAYVAGRPPWLTAEQERHRDSPRRWLHHLSPRVRRHDPSREEEPTMSDATTSSAWSIDGATFHYRARLASGPQLGGFVTLATPSGDVFGQVLSQEVVEEGGQRIVTGDGKLVDHGPGSIAFEDAAVTAAPVDEVEALLAATSAPLQVGGLRNADDVAAVLDARGFNRHTFLCGQSGSGKTYSLGVLLEQLVLRTRLPLLVLDPNGDHVHLGRTKDGIDPETAAAYAEAADGVRVLRAAADAGSEPLRVRYHELGMNGTAAVLQLDPIVDHDEYNAMLHLADEMPTTSFASVAAAFDAFRGSGNPVLDAVRKRGENLGVDRMAAWAGKAGRTLAQIWVEDRPRAIIADSSGFEERRERIAVAVAVLQQLWDHRKERRPLLLVVDEAHDVCPSDPSDELQRLAVELFTRIAGEGRKYGIHLLLASQRPDKLPDNVLTQCDNLLLMRINSTADRAAIAERFGFAPPHLVELAGTFGLGESLVAGKFTPVPLLVKTGARLTPEGGADVPTDWAGS
jgi:uncharacterized protein